MKLSMATTTVATIKVFLCGDVMTGRGIDQILLKPSRPEIHEGHMQTAAGYVHLAERKHGAIPRAVNNSYIWGEALNEFDIEQPDARIINLETSITKSDDYYPKGINYRMNPENGEVLTEAEIDAVSLANNHVLDWGQAGLIETLETLEKLKIKSAGAGRNFSEAAAPAVIDIANKGRILYYALGSNTSGIPKSWSAGLSSPGVAYLNDLSDETIKSIVTSINTMRKPKDVVIVSIHFGPNWSYEVPESFRNFCHELIDKGGVSIIHGHSSHHFKGIELYHNRAIFYGMGDFINDYEGITSTDDAYRDDLVLMYFVEVNPTNGEVSSVRLTPLKINLFRLVRPPYKDIKWIQETLEENSFGVAVVMESDEKLIVQKEVEFTT